MNDLFRAIFGFPPNGNGYRFDDKMPRDIRNNFMGNMGDDDDGDDDDDHFVNMNMDPRKGMFGFSLFSDPFEIHKHFDRLIGEVNKTFKVFGFSDTPGITWEDENTDSTSFYREEPKEASLRDAYLKKPDCACNSSQNTEQNLILNRRTNDIEPGTSNLNPYPKVYSVYIQTVRKPDGSVEIIKKIRDHEGNEKTVITQNNVNDPLPPPQDDQLINKDDTSGISIFKKFFSF